MHDMKILAKDRLILNKLQSDADITNAELAKQVELSPSACLNRVRKLKQVGLIRGLYAKLNASELGYNYHVFVHIKLINQARETLSHIEASVKLNDRIQDCFRMTGDYDYALRLLIQDNAELEFFLANELSRIPYISSIRTEVAMKCVKQDSSLTL